MVKLSAKSVFDQNAYSWPGLTVLPVSSHEWVSIAARHGQTGQMEKYFKKAFGASLPSPTQLVKNNIGFVGWTGQDQWLMQIEATQDLYVDKRIAKTLKGTASVTLQSDAWIALELEGEKVLDLLERLIPLDTGSDAFPPGSLARTQMHHMGVILLRYPGTTDRYQLLSARSSAQSFLHAVLQTAENICGGTPSTS